MRRRLLLLLASLTLIVGVTAGCTVDGQPFAVGGADEHQSGNVDTDSFDKLTLECQVVSPEKVAKAVGGVVARGTFNGAICRWLVDGAVSANVTFNWFEWGNFSVEKEVGRKLGYETENIKIASQSAFTQRDPKRPAMCGVTARAPSRGVYTWWVEPMSNAVPADPCAAPTKLMELLLNGGQ